MTTTRSARNRDDANTYIAAYGQVDTLYVGDFLADHPFAEWAERQRRYYRQLHREATSGPSCSPDRPTKTEDHFHRHRVSPHGW